jgi:hypothetical protein
LGEANVTLSLIARLFAFRTVQPSSRHPDRHDQRRYGRRRVAAVCLNSAMDSIEAVTDSVDSLEAKRNGSSQEAVLSEESPLSPSEERANGGYSGLTSTNDDAGADDDDAFGDFVETPAPDPDPFHGITAASDDYDDVAATVSSIADDATLVASQSLPADSATPTSETDPTNGGAALSEGDPPATYPESDFEDTPRASPGGDAAMDGDDASGPALLQGSGVRAIHHPAIASLGSSGLDNDDVENVESANDANMGADVATLAVSAGSSQTTENPETSRTDGETFSDCAVDAVVKAGQDPCGSAEEGGDSGDVGAAAVAVADVEINVVEMADAGEPETHTRVDPVEDDRKEEEEEAVETVELVVGGNNCVGSADAAPGLDPSSVVPGGDPAKDANDDDDFGDFGDVPAPGPEPGANASEGGGGGDDDFGDFDAAPALDQSPDAKVVSVDVEDDGFGDFDAAPVLDPSPYAKAEPVKVEDDRFGDFDAAPTLDPTPGTNAESVDVEDDSFGDFDAAPALDPSPGTIATTVHVDDDDFGDFDAAPALDPTPGTHATTVHVEDAGFGDFDAAPALDPTPGANATTVHVEDDGFGGFDAAPVLDQPLDANAPVDMDVDDDDFGDFDAAPAMGDDMDDDFGDFDSAPDRSEVGQLTAHSAANSLSQPQGGAMDNSSGALVLRAKAMFSQLFRADSVLDESKTESASSTFDESPTIADVLVRDFGSDATFLLERHVTNTALFSR